MTAETIIDLFEQVRNGDRVAYEQLFKQHYTALVRFARDIVRDTDTAEDLVQEVFVKIWERKESIYITTSLKAYLYMAVKNHCLNKLRVEQKHAFMDESLADDLRFSSNSTDEESNTIKLEQHIKSALDKLPPRCALIFKLSRFEHKTYKEIAEVLELSVKTVENQMGKALQMMRTNLSHYLTLIAFIILSKLFL
ncbi:MAG: RNA polymerase sigma-70 factor [Bacteroidota bacterium]